MAAVGVLVHPATAANAAVTPCSAGLVALTFDDGPALGLTPQLVRILTDRKVPATFFMVGSRVRTAPAEARLVARSGFVVANHTYTHARLTTLSDAAIQSQLLATRRELVRVGITPSRLMRPPYGATSARVDRAVRRAGLVPVLWTVDSRDWTGGTPAQIAARVLGRLRPHRTNVVLQHDGVKRSPASVAAVPRIISGARARGYCFAALDEAGRPAAPVPTLRVAVSGGREARRVPGVIRLTLDRPTSRRVSVRVSTRGGSATSGADFVPVDRVVTFPVGSTTATVTVPVVDDTLVEKVESLTVRFTQAVGLRLSTGSSAISILSDDQAPPPPPPPPSGTTP